MRNSKLEKLSHSLSQGRAHSNKHTSHCNTYISVPELKCYVGIEATNMKISLSILYIKIVFAFHLHICAFIYGPTFLALPYFRFVLFV